MTRIVAAAALLALGACATQPVQTTSAPAAAPSQAPAGSMTEPQARMAAMNGGYSNVSTLTRGGDGMWRGNGVKGGQTVDFTVDPQGKVVAR